MSLASAMTEDDDTLRRLMSEASRAIDRYCRRQFYPLRRTRYYDQPGSPYDEFIGLEHDLLQSYGLSAVNGASEIDSGDYWLQCGDSWNHTPYDRVVLNIGKGVVFNFVETPQRAIHLDGVWGYHEDYANAWILTGASVNEDLPVGTTDIRLTGASDNADTFGFAPAFSTENIIRIGEEYMQVTGASGTSGINVRRGINGTTAASHAASVGIYRWEPESDIEYSARELTVFQYQSLKSPLMGRVATTTLGGFSISTPNAWPAVTKDRLMRYKRDRVHGF